MTKFKWNLYELRNNLNYMEKIYNEETDETNKEFISVYIDMYREMINLAIINNNNENDLLNDELVFKDTSDLINEQINSYKNNSLEILNIVLQSFLELKKVCSGITNLTDERILCTNNELINVTNDFNNKMLPNSIKDKFIIDNHNQNIHISYTEQNNIYSGLTLFDPILRKKYIYISRNNSLIDLVTLPHELFHYVFNDYDATIVSNYNTYYTTEIEGCFANILFGDYFYKNSSYNNNYFNEYFLEVFHSEISELVIRNSFLDSIRDNKKIRMNKLNKTLNYWDLFSFNDEDEIKDYLSNPLEVGIKYALGYLVGVDLFYIYQNDPEFAFYLLKNLKYIRCENDVINLLRRNHITFMDDNYKNLKDYVKKIERQN